MGDTAIRVAGLGKRYHLGGDRQPYRTVGDQLKKLASIRGLIRRARRAESKPPFWALKGVDFTVDRGEVVGVIGRNGAGKSTLLKILSRITEPTEGEVDIHGRVGSLLEVGTGFHPELTGRENTYLNGAILGMKRAEIVRRFDDIVAFAEVEKFIDTPVKHYSSGMYTRLAFAVAAHLEPDILIVDEVLAVGDAAFQKKCLGKMRDVAGQGRTVLFVSHNLEAISTLCQTGVLLRGGRVAVVGPVVDAVNGYLGEAVTGAAGRYDLTGHGARVGDPAGWITEVALKNTAGQYTSAFTALDSLTVELTVSARRRVRDAKFAVAVEDYLGRRIFAVANYMTPGGGMALDRDAVVTCVVPELRLGSGRYLVSVSVAARDGGMLDSVDGAGWFDVETHDPYGTGEPYSPAYGPVLEKSLWTMA